MVNTRSMLYLSHAHFYRAMQFITSGRAGGFSFHQKLESVLEGVENKAPHARMKGARTAMLHLNTARRHLSRL